MNENKKKSTQNKDTEIKKSSGKRLVIFIILIALALSAYFFIFKKSKTDESPKAENNPLIEKSSEKRIIDSVKKSDSLKIVNKEYVGKYFSERDTAGFRELNSDGTFTYKDFIAKGGGNYAIKGNVITFKYDVGIEAVSNFADNKIIDDDGEVWSKK